MTWEGDEMDEARECKLQPWLASSSDKSPGGHAAQREYAENGQMALAQQQIHTASLIPPWTPQPVFVTSYAVLFLICVVPTCYIRICHRPWRNKNVQKKSTILLTKILLCLIYSNETCMLAKRLQHPSRNQKQISLTSCLKDYYTQNLFLYYIILFNIYYILLLLLQATIDFFIALYNGSYGHSIVQWTSTMLSSTFKIQPIFYHPVIYHSLIRHWKQRFYRCHLKWKSTISPYLFYTP